jgi:hypothetical protein
LSGLPYFYKDKIQYDEPKTLTETIRKDKYLYEKGKGRESLQNIGRIRRKRNMIREGRDSNLLSTETTLIKIIKISLLRMNPRGRILIKFGSTRHWNQTKNQ